MSRWCVCFRRIRARGSRCAREKFASRKIKLLFSNLNCLNLCRLVAMLANRARKTPVHFPHVRRTKRPTSMRMSRLLCRKMAHSAQRSWIFPRKNSRSCCIFSASSTPQRTQTSASIVAEIKLNADVLVASLMRSLPKKSRAQRCARANFASRTVEFIADLLRF